MPREEPAARDRAMALTRQQPTAAVSPMRANTPRKSAKREAVIMAPPMPKQPIIIISATMALCF